MAEGRRVAVVGSGISGLAAAMLLTRSGAKVTLYEKEHVFGGHTLTDDSGPYPVDLGFQVYNLTTYPHLVGLFETLGVETEPSDMSFALSVDGGALEWGSRGLGAVFAQRSNLLRPSFWRMIWDVIRFGKACLEVARPENAARFEHVSLGEYLHSNGYSDTFVHNYILPMCAAVWSMPSAKTMAFPVVSLVRFWANHHLLDVVQRPVWRVVKGRSREYVKKIIMELEDARTGVGVRSVKPADSEGGRVTVTTEAGDVATYDAVVLATHADVSLAMLGYSCPQAMREVLEACPYGDNDVYLHTDPALMPVRRGTWASWNFLGTSAPGGRDTAVCVSYWVNNLQSLPPDAPDMFVTLNPPTPPAPEKVLRRLTLSHPLVSQASTRAQQRLPDVQGLGGVYLAGAWCGYGFHEDGLKSAIAAAEALGATVPWTPRAVSPKMGVADQLAMAAFDRFAKASITTGHLRFVLPNGEELTYGSVDDTLPAIAPDEEWRGKPRLAATVRLFSAAFFRKVITRHDTGMGESYMDGDWKVDDLGSLLAVVCANARSIEAKRGMLGMLNWSGSKLLTLAHRRRGNTLAGSRRNIEEHYDAGNAMYSLFLDETLTYSGGIHSPGDSLHQAQLNKLDAMIRTAGITAADHVLEIGCGWGSMAIRAAQTTGCRWTGITVSKEQLAEATARVDAAGLTDRITLLFCDYRDTPGAGTYDKVISCEMIEAVGHEHLSRYFATINAMLKTGGRAVIQVITEPDERYDEYCASSDFIREHIFPGGHLPSMGAMVEAARPTQLQVRGVRDVGPDYAVTLRAWRAAWEEKRAAVLQLGYSERFWRKYRFYFAYCEAAFDARYIHNYQILWVKEALPAVPGGGPPAVAGDASKRIITSNPVTQVLLAVYFFLAGIAVSQRRLLMLTPICTAICSLVLSAATTLSAWLLPAYRKLEEREQAWWALDLVHLLYSAAISATVLLRGRVDWLSVAAPPADADALLPDVIVCVSAGFFAFHLWALVHHRLFLRSYLKTLHLTVLLCLFGAAAYKREHTGLLAACLVSEVHSVFYVFGRLQDLIPLPHTSSIRKRTRRLELITLTVFRLAPAAALTAAVALQPDAFATRARWGLCLYGLLHMDAMNARQAWVSYSGPAALTAAMRAVKLHSA